MVKYSHGKKEVHPLPCIIVYIIRHNNNNNNNTYQVLKITHNILHCVLFYLTKMKSNEVDMLCCVTVRYRQESLLWPHLYKEQCSRSLGFIQMHICKTKSSRHVLFREKRLFPFNPSKQNIFVQYFSNYNVMNFNI